MFSILFLNYVLRIYQMFKNSNIHYTLSMVTITVIDDILSRSFIPWHLLIIFDGYLDLIFDHDNLLMIDPYTITYYHLLL